MEIIIVGAGKIGSSLCKALAHTDNNITIIDNDPIVLDKIQNDIDVIGILGNGSSIEVQEQAHVQGCHVFIATTPNDEMNLIACTLAKSLGAYFTIARVRKPEFAQHQEELRHYLGVSWLINPDRLAAQEISRLIQFPSALSVDPFVHNLINMVELELMADSALVGINLAQFRKESPNTLIAIILRNDEAIIPSGSTILMADDRVFVLGRTAELRPVYQLFNQKRNSLRSIFIVGGGTLCYYLLKKLPKQGMKIKLIERDPKICQSISAEFPHVHVIQGDGTDQDLLEQEAIQNYDISLSLTGVDEENILISLYAISQGVSKNVTKVNRVRLLQVLHDTKLQTIITPHESVTTEIIRIVRALNQDKNSNMEAMYRIAHGEVEVMQFFVTSHSKLCGIALKDLSLQDDILIASIIRKEKILVPSGQDSIKAGDRILVVTKDHRIINVDDVLSRE